MSNDRKETKKTHEQHPAAQHSAVSLLQIGTIDILCLFWVIVAEDPRIAPNFGSGVAWNEGRISAMVQGYILTKG
jgi:hypothetical protein